MDTEQEEGACGSIGLEEGTSMKAMTSALVVWTMCLVVPLSGQDVAVVERGRLEPGETHWPTLEPRTTHVWTLPLEAEQFVMVEVRQQAVDVVVSVVDPSGDEIAEVNSSTGDSGAERVRWIATAAGEWHVEVAPFEGQSLGPYEIELVQRRAVEPGDERLVAADRSIMEAMRGLTAERYADAQAALRVLENSLATLTSAQGRYAEAEPLLERALEIREEIHEPGDPAIASTLSHLGALYLAQGRYAEAEPLLERALEIRIAVHGPVGLFAAMAMERLGVLYLWQGRYAEAEPLLKRMLEVWEAAAVDGIPPGLALGMLAGLYRAQGRYAEAEPLLERGLEILEDRYRTENPAIAAALGNLGGLYREQSRYMEAEPLLERALEILEVAYRPGHPAIAGALGNLAGLYREQGKYVEAESLYERALEIVEADYEPGHPAIAGVMGYLAGLYREQGRYVDAEPLYRRALQMFDDSSVNPTGRISARHGLALVLHATERPEEAMDLLRDAIDEVESFRVTFGGDEELQADFIARHSSLYALMTQWLLEAGEVEEALEYAERGRAQVLLDQLAMGQVDLLEGLAPELRDDLRAGEAQAQARLSEYQQRITLVRAREDLSEEERLARIETLRDSVQAADAAFRAVYREIKNLSPLWQRTLTRGGETARLREVQREVVGRDGLLLLYELGPEWSGLFVIPPGGGDVEVVDLELDADAAARLEAEAGVLTPELIGELVGRGARGALAARSSRGDGPRRSGTLAPELVERLTTLREVLVPDPVWERVKAADQVVVIPDGPLYELPFETLVTAAGEEEVLYWIDEGPPVRYGPSMTVLVNLEQERSTRPIGLTSQGGILSVSNPIYDPNEVDGLAEATAEDEMLPSGPQVTRDSYERLGGSLAPLPGTAIETDSILVAFGDDPTLGGVTVLSGANATEPAVRDTLGAFRFLHLATHGLVDQGRSSLFASLAFTPPRRTETAAANDGFLQLHEIYGLRIPEVELAVLSACESNVGDFVEGEGVFALSRGFLVAGASRVIASQWAVNDESTAVLMSVFFREVAEAERGAEAVDYAQALRTAQLVVKDHPDHPEWADPYYWAPFVLTGKR